MGDLFLCSQQLIFMVSGIFIQKDRGTPIEQPTKNNESTVTKEDHEEEDEEHGKLNELRIMTSVTTPVYSSKQKKTKGKDEVSKLYRNSATYMIQFTFIMFELSCY